MAYSSAAVKEDIIDIDLIKNRLVRGGSLKVIGYDDAKGDMFGMRVFKDGSPYDLTGYQCQGYFITPAGGTVVMTGAIAENFAEVMLPQACYAYEGQFTLAIKLVSASQGIESTIRIVDGIVTRTKTGVTVDPGTVVPNLAELLALIADCEDATEDAEEAAEAVNQLRSEFNTPNVYAEFEMNYHINTGSGSDNGVTATYSPSVITLNGTPSAAFSIITISDTFLLTKGTYYFSDGYEAHSYQEPSITIGAASGSGYNVIASNNHVFTINEDTESVIKIRVPQSAGTLTNYKLYPSLQKYDYVKSNSSLTRCLYERSDNLADKNKFTRNYYMSNTGSTTPNYTYFYTEKIPVTVGSQISFSTSRFLAYFNGDTFVSGIENPSSPQTVPSGVNNVVLTGSMSGISSYMVNTGATLKAYQDYMIPKDFTGGGGSSAVRKIIVFGDSWTDIVNTTWTRWPVVLNALDEFSVTSYGVTGSTLYSHITSQINSFLADNVSDVDTFILMGGVNDYRGGVTAANVITAIQGHYATLHAAYPSARFVYLANNQLYYSADQLKYFNGIVESCNTAGIESYAMFAWTAPSQYANDFLHLGNDGNVCLANNIRKILCGGDIKTVVNKYHWDVFDGSSRIGQLNIYEFFENGYPRIEIKGTASSSMANTTKTTTISTKVMYTSAPWSLFPYAMDDLSKRVNIHSPLTESLGTNKEVTSFTLTWVTTTGGIVFTTGGNGLTYEA